MNTLKETITFGSGVFILVISIIALAVIQTIDLPEIHKQSVLFATLTPVVETPRSEEEISDDEMIVTIYKRDHFVLQVPDGALEENGQIIISPRDPGILAIAGDAGWEHILMANIDLTNTEHKLLSSNQFASDVEACFQVNEEAFTEYKSDPSKYRVEIFNSEVSPVRWEPLHTIGYPDRKLICGVTDTASLFALSVAANGSTAEYSTEP